MSRLNTLLRASLESGTHEGSSVGPSLEDYMEYRAALADYEEAESIQGQLTELSDTLTEVEGVVAESRAQDGLTEDQVALQLEMVNNVREVIDGDVAQISIESFASIEVASLEASAHSGGLLKRIWDGFLAMLAKIRDAFKAMWKWIFGGEERAVEASKDASEAAKVAAVAEKAGTPDTEETKEIKVVAESQVLLLEDMRKVNGTVIPLLGSEINAIAHDIMAGAKELSSVKEDGSIPALPAPKDNKKAEEVKQDIETRIQNSAYMASTLASQSSNQRTATKRDAFKGEGTWPLSKTMNVLSTELKGYASDIGKLTTLLKTIDNSISVLEGSLKSNSARVDSATSQEFKTYMGAKTKELQLNINKMQGYRTTIMEMLKKGDAASGKSSAVAKKLSRADLKRQQAAKARGM